MGLFEKLTRLFTRGGRDETLLLKAMEQAKSKHPEQAIETYSQLLNDRGTSNATRARALFNRALAYSSIDNDEKALADLMAVLKLPGLPENVQTAARSQMARVRKRNE